MDTETANQHKQERSRTRWTASLDKIFADLVVKHIQLGNRPNNVFDKKTWNHIRNEFNKQTDLNFNNNQLRKHLDVLRTRFYNLKSAIVQNDFTIDDSCCIGFDLWEDVASQPRPEAIRVKDCPIYDQLCTIFNDTSADGKYAQSSHFESVGNDTAGLTSNPVGGSSHPENPSSSRPVQGNSVTADRTVKNRADRKRTRSSETQPSSEQNKKHQEINDAMEEALLEMLAASRWRKAAKVQNDERFSVTNCIKALDEMGDIDQQLYFAALDLFEEPNMRETFLSLKSDQLRLTWLQGKCG
uniref:Myb/SANT-like domain-containing protein n=1 Tax=Manihot esculenta TaxID=3983 RepID=A0A2C9TZS0_MANES